AWPGNEGIRAPVAFGLAAPNLCEDGRKMQDQVRDRLPIGRLGPIITPSKKGVHSCPANQAYVPCLDLFFLFLAPAPCGLATSPGHQIRMEKPLTSKSGPRCQRSSI